MKPNFKTIFSVALMASVIVLASCSKDDDVKPKTKTDMLTAPTWAFKELSGVDPFTAAFAASFTPTDYKFNANKTYTASLLTLPYDGTWEFAEGETKIILDGDVEETYTIITLDESTLSWKDIDDVTVVYNKK